MIILEMGSGDTCKNDFEQIKAMVDAVAIADQDRKCIIKWQLFLEQKFEHVKTLTENSFMYAFSYAESKGFKTTASVFDKSSLDFLMDFNIPFIKLACKTDKYDFRKHAHDLIEEIPRRMPVIMSCEKHEDINNTTFSECFNPLFDNILACVPLYPAAYQEYTASFTGDKLRNGISDHTVNLHLYTAFRPRIYEKHFVLSWQTSLDKEWAIDEHGLKELLRLEANEK